MHCPNCGRVVCHCTWDEMGCAVDIVRKREREERRKADKPTVIEQEDQKTVGNTEEDEDLRGISDKRLVAEMIRRGLIRLTTG